MSVLLETQHLCKSFSGVPVLRDVGFQLLAGEVHALLGENGAGKSTLMKILSGIHQPTSGDILLEGMPVWFANAHAARKAGIAMIHQELMPFLDLTVAENIYMGQEPVSGFAGWMDRRQLHEGAERLLRELGVRLRTTSKMRDLTVAEMQTVEIAKALAHEARIVIMDEPTSALSEREASALFERVRDLKTRGVALVYISHRIEELFQLADRCTVLRDGAVVGTHAMSGINRHGIIQLMVGRALSETRAKVVTAKGPVALSARRLGKRGRFHDISFDVHRGEVLGLAGLMGAGRTDVVNAIYGLSPADSGQIEVHGKPVRVHRPADALNAGIGLVSEDRKTFGFIPRFGVKQNITLAALRRCCIGGFVSDAAETRCAEEQTRAFRIRAASQDLPVVRLSGGNQQKVAIARTLFTEPEILLLDEPTRGIDVGAKEEVHEMILELARSGKAIVLVSSEIPELLRLSDRLLVMCEGQAKGELSAETATPEEILKLAMPQ